ncbi:MAG: hypothetical protein QM652_10615 [Legionella sp.]
MLNYRLFCVFCSANYPNGDFINTAFYEFHPWAQVGDGILLKSSC